MSVNLTNVYSVRSLPQSKYMQNLFKSNYSPYDLSTPHPQATINLFSPYDFPDMRTSYWSVVF